VFVPIGPGPLNRLRRGRASAVRFVWRVEAGTNDDSEWTYEPCPRNRVRRRFVVGYLRRSTNRKGYLREFSLTSGNLTKGIEVQQGERFHPGGIAVDAESLWFPVAEYRPNSASIIQMRNKRTLGLEFSFNVPDHIGCIAVTPESLVGGNWDSRDFYVWDRTGKLLRKAAANSGNAYQDMKFEGGLLVASGLLPDHTGAVDWLELPSFNLVKRLKFGNTERHASFTREGMAIRGKQLLLLPEDEPSRLFVFSLDR
jgi:Family of unknown function (DUF6454)